jgi:hypothetical protein
LSKKFLSVENEASEGSGYLNIDAVSKVLQNEMKGQEVLQTEGKEVRTVELAKICPACTTEDGGLEHEHEHELGSIETLILPKVKGVIYFQLEDSEKWAKGTVEKVDEDEKTVEVVVLQASDEGSTSSSKDVKSGYASNLELSKEMVNKLTKSLASDYVDNKKHLTHLQFVEAVPRLLKEMIR